MGTVVLFYACNVLPVYVSVCHVFGFPVEWMPMRLANMSVVANSSLKIFVYVGLSRSFRKSLVMALASRTCKRDRVRPMDNLFGESRDSRRAFLDHVKVAATIQAQAGRQPDP